MGIDNFKITDIVSWVVPIAGSFFVIKYKVENIVKRQDIFESKQNSHSERIAVMELQIKSAVESQQKMDMKLSSILDKINKIAEDVAILKYNSKGGNNL